MFWCLSAAKCKHTGFQSSTERAKHPSQAAQPAAVRSKMWQGHVQQPLAEPHQREQRHLQDQHPAAVALVGSRAPAGKASEEHGCLVRGNSHFGNACALVRARARGGWRCSPACCRRDADQIYCVDDGEVHGVPVPVLPGLGAGGGKEGHRHQQYKIILARGNRLKVRRELRFQLRICKLQKGTHWSRMLLEQHLEGKGGARGWTSWAHGGSGGSGGNAANAAAFTQLRRPAISPRSATDIYIVHHFSSSRPAAAALSFAFGRLRAPAGAVPVQRRALNRSQRRTGSRGRRGKATVCTKPAGHVVQGGRATSAWRRTHQASCCSLIKCNLWLWRPGALPRQASPCCCNRVPQRAWPTGQGTSCIGTDS